MKKLHGEIRVDAQPDLIYNIPDYIHFNNFSLNKKIKFCVTAVKSFSTFLN
tara:strand:+ start:5666 stop:5818 length:153 start_codon:yes stop_codon:yes gene_type:complete